MADYPNTDFKTLKFTSNQKVNQSVSESGKTQTRLIGGQKFMASINHAAMTKAEYFALDAFLMSQQGRDQSFTVSFPDKTGLGAVTGSPTTHSDRVAGQNTVAIHDLVPSTTDVFVASDMINFSNHSKGYKIVSTVSSNAADEIAKADGTGVLLKADGTGSLLMARANQAIVTIFPPLVEDVADGSTVSYGVNFTLTMEVDSDIQSYKVIPPNIYEKQVNLVEYIP